MATLYISSDNPTRATDRAPLDSEDTSDRRSIASPIEDTPSHDTAVNASNIDHLNISGQKPNITRYATDPTPLSSSLNGNAAVAQSKSLYRNRSPYSRSSLRPRSSGSTLASPAMTRSHSWAGNSTRQTSDSTSASTNSPFPSSSIRVPVRAQSPLRTQEDYLSQTPPQKWWYDIPTSIPIESIQEDSELDIAPRGQSSLSMASHSVSRSSSLRRRPASPLHSMTNAPSQPSAYHSEGFLSFNSANQASPALGPQRFNEAYPSLHHYASSSSFSSISSTPTSQRSRSPSISSLETIEDVPDLESEAVEAERIDRLKIAAERAENGDDGDDGVRRRSLEVPRGFGFSRGGSRERKRWSVCGGERRADLDLETIWED